MSPGEVNRTSFWQLMAAWNGYVAANTPDKGKLSESEVDALFEWVNVEPAPIEMPPMPSLEWTGSELKIRA